jgi:hypothetical protein
MSTVWIDREGEVWRPNGVDRAGEQLLACSYPQNPADRGDGPSFPWTLPTVTRWFGPLTVAPDPLEAEFADLEQNALAEADRKFDDVHGPATEWSPLEEIGYVLLIERVHRVFHPDQAQAGTQVAA